MYMLCTEYPIAKRFWHSVLEPLFRGEESTEILYSSESRDNVLKLFHVKLNFYYLPKPVVSSYAFKHSKHSSISLWNQY